jgi:hypothetical protein
MGRPGFSISALRNDSQFTKKIKRHVINHIHAMGPLSLFVYPEIIQKAMPDMGFGQGAIEVEESCLVVRNIHSAI